MTNLKTKEELIRNLECTKHTFYIVTFGVHHLYMSHKEGWPIGNYASAPESLISDYTFGLHQYLEFYENRPDKEDAWLANISDAYRSAERTYLNETYEWIKDYVNNPLPLGGNQYEIFEQQDWFRMARCIRNALSHNWIISFTNRDKRDIQSNGSISLFGVTIDIDDEGKGLGDAGWHRGHTIDLCEKMLEFSRAIK